MKRTNITISILAVLILILSVLCWIGWPLITRVYVPEMYTVVGNFGGTYFGGKILTHYLHRIQEDIPNEIGPSKGLTPKEVEQTSFLLLGRLFSALVVLAGFIASAALFIINSGGQGMSVSKSRTAVIVAMVIIAGTLIRLILAVVMYGNFDMQSYQVATKILDMNGNVYAMTGRYNYSPIWFMILFALNKIHLLIPGLLFHIAVKSFLTCVDLLTLWVLIGIAGIRKLPTAGTAIFFYLSPVSFLLTGYHGQFENLAMLMVLTGIFMYLRFVNRPVLRTALLWLFSTAGMIIKHNTFYELIICLHSSVKRYWVKLALFAISVIMFLSLFIPYWKTGSKGIIENVFMYGSVSGSYGVTSLFALPQLKYLFIAAMFIFPFFLKGRDIIARCLLGVLFFLTFTTGCVVQYFALPVALGALRPTKSFLFYTLAGSIVLLGNRDNVFIPGFHLFPLNLVWFAVICWFIAEMWLDRRSAGIAASH